ncbi:MAG: phage terminase small subunit P27 family [Firmicutes bacterium]|nr:phage terminase small subunit P27 family [Bacillota bacterium]
MATRGRKPKPTAMKILEGNPSRRALNENEPKPHTAVSDCPEWLEDEAKAEWARMGGILEDMGVLTEVDTTAFAGYCQAYARWKEAEEFLSQHGSIIRTPNGYLQQVPQVSIAQTNLKIMLKFCEQFGLTPSARSRIVANKSIEETTDAMEKLLRGE